MTCQHGTTEEPKCSLPLAYINVTDGEVYIYSDRRRLYIPEYTSVSKVCRGNLAIIIHVK